MFSALPAASFTSAATDSLAASVMALEEPPSAGPDPENSNIPAGWTYFGQFVDHDLTLDDRPLDLTTPTTPGSLTNGRTPKLDLDSLYGQGPLLSPTLFEQDGVHMKVGALLTGSPDTQVRDLPRAANGQAILGDSRNDENRMVAAIHAAYLRFHNQTVDKIKAAQPTLSSADLFAAARRDVTRSYQWTVLNEYLPTITSRSLVDSVARVDRGRLVTNLRFYNPCSMQMPVEFSVAAYRFGHSMVRASYQLNSSLSPLPVFSGTFKAGSDVSGFYPSPSNFAVDWDFFLPRPDGTKPATMQGAYKIDASLTASLGKLPLPPTTAGAASLARRNLLRGTQLGLPSGQAVARAMGVTPLRDDQIMIGAATGDPADTKKITDISPTFANNAPLWVYVLAEAAASADRTGGTPHLGPVGGRIVVETIVGLLAADKTSIANTPLPAAPPVPLRAVLDGRPSPARR